MACRRGHKGSPVGVTEGVNSGDCWRCAGKPPWVCSECRRPFPCEHHSDVANTKEEAEARERLYQAIDAYALGVSSWAVVERAIEGVARATRTAYAERLRKASQN